MRPESVSHLDRAGAAAPDRLAPAQMPGLGWEGRLRRLRTLDVIAGLLLGLVVALLVPALAIVGLGAMLALAVCVASLLLTRRRRLRRHR